MLWTKSFLEEQGHRVKRNTVYQDNKSATLLEGNWEGFIKQKNIPHATGKTTVEYFPTSEMVADFHTKPLQGNMFNKYRDLILNDNHNQGVSLYTKQRQDPRSMLSKQVRKVLSK